MIIRALHRPPMSRNGPIALAFHTLFIAFVLAPILIVCVVAFTPEGYLSLPTNGPSLRWFRAIADYPEFVRAFRDSLWLAALSSTIAVLFAVPAALAVARYRFTGREAVLAFFMSPLMIPHVVLGIAFVRGIFDETTPHGFSLFIGWASILFFGFCTIVALWRLVTQRGPVVTITPQGIRDIRIVEDFIPWAAIRNISTWEFQRQKAMVLAVDPAVERKLPLTVMARAIILSGNICWKPL